MGEKTIYPTSHAGERKCADCDFMGVEGTKLVCCLEPPKLFTVPMQTPQGLIPQVVRAHPEMRPDEWCGQFKRASHNLTH